MTIEELNEKIKEFGLFLATHMDEDYHTAAKMFYPLVESLLQYKPMPTNEEVQTAIEELEYLPTLYPDCGGMVMGEESRLLAIKALQQYKAETTRQPQPQVTSEGWIKFADRQPDKWQKVLILTAYDDDTGFVNYVRQAELDGSRWYDLDSNTASGVGYWMPLPEPPKGESK
jgi:hypothetical protein